MILAPQGRESILAGRITDGDLVAPNSPGGRGWNRNQCRRVDLGPLVAKPEPEVRGIVEEAERMKRLDIRRDGPLRNPPVDRLHSEAGPRLGGSGCRLAADIGRSSAQQLDQARRVDLEVIRDD